MHLSPEFTDEIRLATNGLPLYNGGPGVDYTYAPDSYALNVTLWHDPEFATLPVGYQPGEEASLLLVQRASGHGKIGAWSGVSGYIDTLNDPGGSLSASEFDPVRYTVENELYEECGLDREALAAITFYPAEPFTDYRRHDGNRVHVLPVLGWCGVGRPEVNIDPRELSAYDWVKFSDIQQRQGLAGLYLSHTLRRALAAIDIAL